VVTVVADAAVVPAVDAESLRDAIALDTVFIADDGSASVKTNQKVSASSAATALAVAFAACAVFTTVFL